MIANFLFAYGTLRQEFSLEINHQLTSHIRLAGKGYFIGRLFEVNHYPGAIENAQQGYPILGEIYEILDSEKAFEILDNYEQCTEQYPQPHEYIRKTIRIFTEQNKTLQAWVYLYNYNTEGLVEIINGDYLSFARQSN